MLCLTIYVVRAENWNCCNFPAVINTFEPLNNQIEIKLKLSEYTLITEQFYLQPPWQNLIWIPFYENHPCKMPVPVMDTFSAPWGCLLWYLNSKGNNQNHNLNKRYVNQYTPTPIWN